MSVIQYNLYDYLKIVYLLCYNYNKNIPNELILHVFSYLKNDIIEKFQKQYVYEQILYFFKFQNRVNNVVVRKFNDTFNLHINQVPYYSLNNINSNDLKNIILNIDSNFYTSHYCCNGKGIVMFFGSQRYCHFIRNM
jgi:hypothetical protein